MTGKLWNRTNSSLGVSVTTGEQQFLQSAQMIPIACHGYAAGCVRVILAFVTLLVIAISTTSIGAAPSTDPDRQLDAAAPNDVPFFISEELVKLCEPGQFAVHKDGQPDRTLNYRLFKPTQVHDSERFPIIIWMHGHGDHELSYYNVGQLKHIKDLVFPNLTNPSIYRFYLLAVQCPKDEQWTCTGQSCDECSGPCDAAAVTIMIAKQLMKQLPIDADRVYLVGISSGGTAAWEMAKRRPDFFAAVAPLASAGGGTAKLDLIKGIPIWAFHVKEDPDVSVAYDRSTIAELLTLGGNCALTETHGEPHDCWGTAFLKYDLLHWLMSQRRGALDSPRPGTLISAVARSGPFGRFLIVLFHSWPQFAALTAIVALCWVLRRELKKSALPSDAVAIGASPLNDRDQVR